MYKKIILASAIYASSNMTFAGTPYVGGSMGWNQYAAQSSGPIGTVFGGYGVRLEQNKKIYLGGELNATAGYYTHQNISYSLGASFIPGVMVADDTMIYTRIGVNGGYTYYNWNQSTSGIKANVIYGLGVQTALSEKWDIRGEYTTTSSYRTGTYSVGLVYKIG